MSYQQVPVGNGPQWLIGAVQLILKNPGPFALMGLLVAVIALVPILGALALLVLNPALYGGIMYAAREQEAGRTVDFQQLFQAFREEGKLGKMIMLCLPAIAAAVAIGVLAVVFFGGALWGAIASGASESAVGASLGVSALIFAPLALAIGLISFALTFFATPRVMLAGVEPIAAMKDSVGACIANVGPVLVFALLLLGAAIVLGITIGLIPLVGGVALTTALVPVFSVASYLAWRQVYRNDITQELPASPPPPPSAAA